MFSNGIIKKQVASCAYKLSIRYWSVVIKSIAMDRVCAGSILNTAGSNGPLVHRLAHVALRANYSHTHGFTFTMLHQPTSHPLPSSPPLLLSHWFATANTNIHAGIEQEFSNIKHIRFPNITPTVLCIHTNTDTHIEREREMKYILHAQIQAHFIYTYS